MSDQAVVDWLGHEVDEGERAGGEQAEPSGGDAHQDQAGYAGQQDDDLQSFQPPGSSQSAGQPLASDCERQGDRGQQVPKTLGRNRIGSDAGTVEIPLEKMEERGVDETRECAGGDQKQVGESLERTLLGGCGVLGIGRIFRESGFTGRADTTNRHEHQDPDHHGRDAQCHVVASPTQPPGAEHHGGTHRGGGDSDRAEDPVPAQGPATGLGRGDSRNQRQAGGVIDAGESAHDQHRNQQRRHTLGTRSNDRRDDASEQVDDQQPAGSVAIGQPAGEHGQHPERNAPGRRQRPGRRLVLFGRLSYQFLANHLLDTGQRQFEDVHEGVSTGDEQDESDGGAGHECVGRGRGGGGQDTCLGTRFPVALVVSVRCGFRVEDFGPGTLV